MQEPTFARIQASDASLTISNPNSKTLPIELSVLQIHHFIKAKHWIVSKKTLTGEASNVVHLLADQNETIEASANNQVFTIKAQVKQEDLDQLPKFLNPGTLLILEATDITQQQGDGEPVKERFVKIEWVGRFTFTTDSSDNDSEISIYPDVSTKSITIGNTKLENYLPLNLIDN
jgi:hypothetical protein